MALLANLKQKATQIYNDWEAKEKIKAEENRILKTKIDKAVKEASEKEIIRQEALQARRRIKKRYNPQKQKEYANNIWTSHDAIDRAIFDRR